MSASLAFSRQALSAAQVALVAAVYLAAASASLVLAIPPGYASAVWPPSGIALAATLLLGARALPGIWLGAALANFAVELSVPAALLHASGDTLEALVAALALRRHVGDIGSFRRGEDVVKFIAICAASATIAASVAVASLALWHGLAGDEVLRNWWTWWQGDTAGMIIVAPLVLSWRTGGFAAWPRLRKAEAAAFVLLLLGSAAAISGDDAAWLAPFSLVFITLPFILWAAFRFGQREVAIAIAVACGVAVWTAIERRELLASVALNELLLMLLTFIGMVVSTGLVLAAVMAERSRAALELRYYDALTGLPNMAMFRERLPALLRAASAEGGKLAVAVLDVERFKTFNASFGRETADGLLRQVAARVAGDAAGNASAARVGPDRFAVAFPGVRDAQAAASSAGEALARWFGPPFSIAEAELAMSARAGIALFPEHGADADALFLKAETALNKAKALAERLLVYAPQMSAHVAERLALENRLRRAIERGELVLHYQPKVDLDERRLAGVEALLRWRSPELGLVPPMDFVPVLEETGMILEVGRWALRRAVLDQRRWASARLHVPRVAVNVSSIQLRQPDFVEHVRRALGAGPHLIDLEITESRIMEDIESNIGKLAGVRELGLAIAIDDFGTGYSSLAYLAKLPVQMLKIDRAFIGRMLQDDETMALVQTIISLARTLQLKTVAEGVESAEQADVLEMLRCDQMQGYFVSRPAAGEAMTGLLSPGWRAGRHADRGSSGA